MRRYDPGLSTEAEKALLEAGAWPHLVYQEYEDTDGLGSCTSGNIVWFVPLTGDGVRQMAIAMVVYRSVMTGCREELIAKDNYYLKNHASKEVPWDDPRELTPPPGWRWFGLASDFILQWSGKR